MARSTWTFLLTAALAFLALPLEAAQRGGGRGGGRGGFGRGGFGRGGFRGAAGFRPGFARRPVAFRGIGPRGRFVAFRPRRVAFVRFRGFSTPGFGLFLNYGGFPGFGTGSWFPYSMGYSGYYSPLDSEEAIPYSSGPTLRTDPESKQSDNLAHLLLIVPENATVWFDDVKMTRAGTEREFVSPSLSPGKKYVYNVRVRYKTQAGKVVDETRRIYIRGGDRWRVDFSLPAPKLADQLPAPSRVPGQ
jgi:uncharacterized protein (TIGR03000 family)